MATGGGAGGKPKYEQVKDLILDRIRSGDWRSGDRLPPEPELTEAMGVSRHTLRQAVGDLVQEGWLDRRHGSGTYVLNRAGGGRRGAPALVGVVTTYFSEYIFPSIVRGIEAYLSERGYGVVLASTDNQRDREPACLAQMLERGVSGLIIEPAQSALPDPNLSMYQAMSDRGLPYVMINGTYFGLGAPAVTLDDCGGAYQLTRHLLDLGHRSIAALVKTDDVQGVERERGVRLALSDSGILPREDWFCRYSTRERELKPVEFVQGLVSGADRPTALVCYNDQIALQVLPVLERAGLRVPDDISVTGFDNSNLLASAGVPLTTAAHPQEELGRQAAELLCDLMDGEARPYRRSVRYLPGLVVRSSTARPPEQ